MRTTAALALCLLASPALAVNGNTWFGAAPPNLYSAAPADPATTTSTTLVMMGLGSAYKLTPTSSGVLKATVCGDLFNNTGTDGVKFQITFGSGAAPANGVAVTGTAMNPVVTYSGAAASAFTPFCMVGIATGLTLGTSYWLDAPIAAVGGGTAAITNLSVLVEELP